MPFSPSEGHSSALCSFLPLLSDIPVKKGPAKLEGTSGGAKTSTRRPTIASQLGVKRENRAEENAGVSSADVCAACAVCRFTNEAVPHVGI